MHTRNSRLLLCPCKKKTNDIADYREAAIRYESLYDEPTPNRHILEKLGMCYEALAKYPTTSLTDMISLYKLAIQYHTQLKGLELHVKKTHKILGDKYAELSRLEPGNFLHYEDVIKHYKEAGTYFCSNTEIGLAYKQYADILRCTHPTIATNYYELARDYDPNIEITELHDTMVYSDITITTPPPPLLKPIHLHYSNQWQLLNIMFHHLHWLHHFLKIKII